MADLEPLDPAYVAKVLSNPPFVVVDGVINVRDLGLYPSTSHPGKVTRPGFLYRGAELSAITEDGKTQLRDLGISIVYDLRSDIEVEKYKAPRPVIDGVEVLHTPVFRMEDYSPETIARRFKLYSSGKTEAFMELYSQILDHGNPSFGTILRRVRDKPSEGLLFHCTAGKDRTGVIAAILLKLAGVSDELVAEEYALTRIGREPAREMIMARLSKEPLFASNNEAALNMFTCRHETMLAFLTLLEDNYGGVEKYVKLYLGLSNDDITTIRNNILMPNISRL